MDEREWLTERFERHRPRLRAVAYRMLGSVSDADDALQEAWLRIRDQDPRSVENLQAWLTTVVGKSLPEHAALPTQPTGGALGRARTRPGRDSERQCRSRAGSAARRLGRTGATGGARRATPAERLAFGLHDVFGVPFTDIVSVLDRSEAAAQQLASRARRRVRGSPEPDPDLARQREVDAFFAASRDGDFDALLAVLDPDVELRIDGGVLREEASLVLHGADAVASHTANYAKLYPFMPAAIVNGAAGAVVAPRGRLFSVMAFTVTKGKITQIDALVDPERLAELDLRLPGA